MAKKTETEPQIEVFRSSGGGSKIAAVEVVDKPKRAARSVVAKVQAAEIPAPTPSRARTKPAAVVNEKSEPKPVAENPSRSTSDISGLLDFIKTL